MRLINFLIIIFLSLAFKPVNMSLNNQIDINLSNIRNNEGYLYIFIYTFKNQYPYEPFKYYKVAKDKVNNGKLTARISNLKISSQCALTLIDDENNNEDLDRWLGLPTEGYGFSNNVTPLFSLPDYEDLIVVPKPNQTLNIKVQYLL
jgi:uncharacterized protein (DUF2141 family)